MLVTKNDDILNVNAITCIDCGKEIELPSHRIPTNDGYKWICRECKDKIKCKK